MKRLYLCRFSVFKDGNRNSRPYIRTRYIRAADKDDAYARAREICKTGLLTVRSTDTVTCRQYDIETVHAKEASHVEVDCQERIIDRYAIMKDPECVLQTFFGTTGDALRNLRSAAFDMANSGKYGIYPVDEINDFNDTVEEGFSDNGMSWESLNGTILKIKTI